LHLRLTQCNRVSSEANRPCCPCGISRTTPYEAGCCARTEAQTRGTPATRTSKTKIPNDVPRGRYAPVIPELLGKLSKFERVAVSFCGPCASARLLAWVCGGPHVRGTGRPC